MDAVALVNSPSLREVSLLRFEEIYQSHFNEVYRFLLRLTGDRDLAEEITSETFFRALKSIDSFRGDCSLSVWLCQIAKNCYFSYLKKNSRLIPVADEQLQTMPDPEQGPEEILLEQTETQRVQQILRELPEPYREVFILRIYAEADFRQIGELFGKTSNWACVTYHRARKKIMDRVED